MILLFALVSHVCALSLSPSARLIDRKNERPPLRDRRSLLSSFLLSSSLAALTDDAASAAETVGKDPDCNDKSCLGVWDGLLADCPHQTIMTGGGAGCTSSQDDTPTIFAEPWDYSNDDNLDWEAQMKRLQPAIELVSSKRGDQVRFIQKEGRYLRAIFEDGKSGERSVGEFYFTPNDTTVQFRIASLDDRGSGLLSPSLKNMERGELIRKQMRYEKLPVLRNRRRSLLFVESDLDTFGPGSASLGPPAEMTTEELEGRDEFAPRDKLEVLQAFPVRK